MKWLATAMMVLGALLFLAATGSRLSPDAIGMALGMVLGVLGGVPTAALVLLARREHDAPVTYIVQIPDHHTQIGAAGGTTVNEPAAPPTTRRTYDFAISRYVRCADCDRWRSADIATCQCGSRRLAIINPDAPEEAQP